MADKSKDEKVTKEIVIKVIEQGEIQTFLKDYSDLLGNNDIQDLFSNPIVWKNITIETGYLFDVTFDELTFQAELKEIKVSKSYKQGEVFFTYQLVFKKDLDAEADLILPSFLNQKELNEDEKKVLVVYNIGLDPIRKTLLD